jgi:hypothetical protein
MLSFYIDGIISKLPITLRWMISGKGWQEVRDDGHNLRIDLRSYILVALITQFKPFFLFTAGHERIEQSPISVAMSSPEVVC